MPGRPHLRTAQQAARGLVACTTLLLAGCGGGPPEVSTPPAADLAACTTLAAALPERLADLAPVPYQPADAPGGAWGDPAITLSCGTPTPAGFGPASSCIDANGVDWFAPDDQTNGDGDVDLTSVTLVPHVALHVPKTYRGATLAAALADLAEPLKAALTPDSECL
ncbi:DUF3515 family protein [Nocardioides sp.]|uniref:DUF3515 family protein n=1 Tax=Nocardioides sp. TaxID=35761 RepID=UPI0039E7037B